MGYYLNAFIGKQNEIEVLSSSFAGAVKVDLGQDIFLTPMTEELFDEINGARQLDGLATFEYLTGHIEFRILKLIAGNKLAYVEAEYFGGEGGQLAIIWEHGERKHLFNFGQGNINEVLKDFGVKALRGKDEFATLHLGRHRNTIDWISPK